MTDGHTALVIAKSTGHAEVVELLEAAQVAQVPATGSFSSSSGSGAGAGGGGAQDDGPSDQKRARRGSESDSE